MPLVGGEIFLRCVIIQTSFLVHLIHSDVFLPAMEFEGGALRPEVAVVESRPAGVPKRAIEI